jgi:hypothetical protein
MTSFISKTLSFASPSSLWKALPRPVKELAKTAAVASSYFIPGGPFVQIPLGAAAAYKAFIDRPIIFGNQIIPFSRSGPSLPENPKKSLSDLTDRVPDFFQNYPPNYLSHAHFQQPRAIEAPEPTTQELIDSPIEDVVGINPPDGQENWKIISDKQLSILADNITYYGVIRFIHPYCLETDEADNLDYMKIIQEVSTPIDGEKPSLWSAYRKHLGKNLTWYQCIWRYLCYTLAYSIGLFSNSIETFLYNVTDEFRKKLGQKKDKSKLDGVVTTFLIDLQNFVENYNKATEAYKDDRSADGGSVQSFREKVTKNLHGSLEKLCADFTDTAVEQFFPQIPFFRELKKNSLFGWFFEGLEWIFGSPLNYIGREIVRSKLPAIVESLVRTGIDKTAPQYLPFVTAINRTIAEFMADMNKLMDTPGGGESDFMSSPLDGASKQLPILIKNLMDLLDLTRTDDPPPQFPFWVKYPMRAFDLMDTEHNPLLTREDYKRKLDIQKKERGSAGKWLNKTVHDAIAIGIQKGCNGFFHHLVDNPQATEKMFGKLLELCNLPFQAGDPEAEWEKQKSEQITSHDKLKEEARSLFQKLTYFSVNELILGVPAEIADELRIEAHDRQKASAVHWLNQLVPLSLSIKNKINEAQGVVDDSLLKDLSRYVTVINEFAHRSYKLPIGKLPHQSQQGFYTTFYPIYKQAKQLLDQAFSLRDRQVKFINQRDQIARLESALEQFASLNDDQIEANLLQNSRSFEFLTQLQPFLAKNLPKDGTTITAFNRQFENLERHLSKSIEEKTFLSHLKRLGGRGLLYELGMAVQGKPSPRFDRTECTKNIGLAISSLPAADQNRLLPLIRELENFDSTQPHPNIRTIWDQIQQNLIQISDVHVARLETHFSQLIKTKNQLRTWMAKAYNAYQTAQQKNLHELSQESASFDTQTKEVNHLVQEAQAESQFHPLQLLPLDSVINGSTSKVVMPIVMAIFTKAYEFLMNIDIHEALARMIMHQTVESYKKKK